MGKSEWEEDSDDDEEEMMPTESIRTEPTLLEFRLTVQQSIG